MFDPKNRLNFNNKTCRDKLYEITKCSLFIFSLSEEEKDIIKKSKANKNFGTNKIQRAKIELIYEKYSDYKNHKQQ